MVLATAGKGKDIKDMTEYKAAAYVKLAKLWERSRDEAVNYHHHYCEDKYRDNRSIQLYDVYIDITGHKSITGRPKMLRVLKACKNGEVNLILSQTRAYLAANTEEFFFLIFYLYHLPNRIDIVTEEIGGQIDTISNEDHQREALSKAAEDFIQLYPEKYKRWKLKVETAIAKMGS